MPMLKSVASKAVRMMATLGHFARWLQGRVAFAADDPRAGVTPIKLDEPSWNGLSKKDLF